MTVAYIAIGSNLASSVEQVMLPESIGRYSRKPHSCCFFVLPHPTAGAARSTRLLKCRRRAGNHSAPEELLNHTQRIELQQGRVRKAERWGPRTLDPTSCCLQ
ncbi:hypothetical protein DMI69_12775 [Escherichia coli]|nr:hypothetical protein [Escherichia coli]